jgi:hypothetical protein
MDEFVPMFKKAPCHKNIVGSLDMQIHVEIMKPCDLLDRYQRFEWIWYLCLESISDLLPSVLKQIFFRNIGICLPNYTALHTRQFWS